MWVTWDFVSSKESSFKMSIESEQSKGNNQIKRFVLFDSHQSHVFTKWEREWVKWKEMCQLWTNPNWEHKRHSVFLFLRSHCLQR
jgi:hypothetical protein